MDSHYRYFRTHTNGIKLLPYLISVHLCSQASIGGVLAATSDLTREQAEARVIDRRRRLEDERKMRIFNAKQRTIGLDVQVYLLITILFFNFD